MPTPARWRYAPCPGNNCGTPLRLIGEGVPSVCPACGHVLTPPEQETAQQEATDGE